MKILVDGRVLKHKKITGVENYTTNIIKHLKKITCLTVVTPMFRNKYYCHFWEHFILPLKALKYDTLFAPANIAPIYLPKKIKLILTVHDLSFKDFPHYYSFLFKSYYNFLVPINLKRANHVITISNFSEKRIQKDYPFIKNKINFIYHGISEKFIQNKNIKKENYILYIGSCNEIKNFTSVLKIFLTLNVKDLKLKMILPTSNLFVLSKENKKLLLKAKKNDSIEIFDYLEQEDLVSFYQKAKLFLFPSYHESFGFPILEAISCGTPVVCSNLSALTEIGGECVEYCNPYDLEDIKTKVIKVLNDESLQKNMINKGVVYSKRFTWQKSAYKHFEIFTTKYLKDKNET